ncbi:MAG: FapA family protein [Proteobacteria bacterium]|nr:DUF342 domain-containing protein [Desulfobulbaceae bacterium]MBU4153990.1 FapA family protein [Pseudomonadota bacterium]MDP2106832.1 FapA family protein [Desulfobulbaceae bacterium]
MSKSRDKRSLDSLDDIYLEAIKTSESENRDESVLSEDFLSGTVFSAGIRAESDSESSYGQLVIHSLAEHDPAWFGKEVAISADKMRVTVKVSLGNRLSAYQLNYGLEQLGVTHGVLWQALTEVERYSKSGIQGEVLVARGTPAESRRSVNLPEVQRVSAIDGSIFWLAEGVKIDSTLRSVLSLEQIEKIDHSVMIAKAVSSGTVLFSVCQNSAAKSGMNVMGEIIDPDEDFLPVAGDNVRHNEATGVYEAALYGYLVCEEDTISVLPPIWISPDRRSAYYVNCTQIGSPVYPSSDDLLHCLSQLNVQEQTIRKNIIKKLTDRFAQGQLLSAKSVKIAEAIAPRPGRNARYDFFVDIGEMVGPIRSDGTFDLCSRNSVVLVVLGDLIAEKTTVTKGVDGFDVFGEVLKAEDGIDQHVAFDDVVRVEEREGQIFYYAQKNGNIRFSLNKLTIADVYIINGNVDVNTGNIDRQEDLLIKGSVLAGFMVRSKGSIDIAGSIYNGAKVLAGNDITVGEGIIGIDTRVVVLGNLTVVYVQEAEIIVKGDATVLGYIYNAVVRANGTITVVSDPQHGRRSGRIISGLTCSSKAIVVSKAGHPSRSGTVIAIHPDPEHTGQMKKLEEEGRNCRESIARISRSLPFESFDSVVIKKALAQLPEEKRKPLIKLLTTFNNLIKRQQNIELLRKELSGKMLKNLRTGSIQIIQEIRQGTEIQFGDKKICIAEDMGGATFTLYGGEIFW